MAGFADVEHLDEVEFKHDGERASGASCYGCGRITRTAWKVMQVKLTTKAGEPERILTIPACDNRDCCFDALDRLRGNLPPLEKREDY